MAMSNTPGHTPGAAQSDMADGQGMGAPASMSDACQQAADSAVSQRADEAGKVGMGVHLGSGE